jgi:hypothetical protein
MMRGIHLGNCGVFGFPLKEGRNSAQKRYAMPGVFAVRGFVSYRGIEMLNQRTSERNVDKLQTSANALNGDFQRESFTKEPDLRPVESVVHSPASCISFAVKLRVNVAAPGEQYEIRGAKLLPVRRKRPQSVKTHSIEPSFVISKRRVSRNNNISHRTPVTDH